MSGDDSEILGHPVAHTPERAEKIGATAAATEAAMADLAAQMQPEPEAEQQSLMLDEMDDQHCLFAGPVKHVASILDGAKRARGRPKGSQNKASREFAQTLMRMGFKHPGLNLAALANADPVALATEIACLPTVEGYTPLEHIHAAIQTGVLKRADVIGLMDKAYDLIKSANAELMPYFESKKAQPIEEDTNRSAGNFMIIGQMIMQQPEERRTIDLTNVDAPDQ